MICENSGQCVDVDSILYVNIKFSKMLWGTDSLILSFTLHPECLLLVLKIIASQHDTIDGSPRVKMWTWNGGGERIGTVPTNSQVNWISLIIHATFHNPIWSKLCLPIHLVSVALAEQSHNYSPSPPPQGCSSPKSLIRPVYCQLISLLLLSLSVGQFMTEWLLTRRFFKGIWWPRMKLFIDHANCKIYCSWLNS